MPENVSIIQLLGPVVLALAAVLWVMGLARLLRRTRPEATPGHSPASRTSGRPPPPRKPWN